jgi:hypothetical protein
MAWAVTQPVRPVTPPCRHAISGRPAHPRAIAARARVLADGIPTGQRKNVPPMYLGAVLCRERSPRSAAPAWAASVRARQHTRGDRKPPPRPEIRCWIGADTTGVNRPLTCGNRRYSTTFTIFEEMSEIQRTLIGRTVTGPDVCWADLRIYLAKLRRSDAARGRNLPTARSSTARPSMRWRHGWCGVVAVPANRAHRDYHEGGCWREMIPVCTDI